MTEYRPTLLEGDDVEEEPRLRTMFMTYQADDDDAADTFMIVLGTVAENIRGVKVVEYQDDTVFADGQDVMDVLHAVTTGEERLTAAQRAELEDFAGRLKAWDEEGGG